MGTLAVDKQQVRPDTGPIHSERPGKDSGMVTWWSLTLMSLPPRSSNDPYCLCKPRVAKLWWRDLSQTITSYCVSISFLRERLAISPSVMPHFPTTRKEGKGISHLKSSQYLHSLKQNYIFCQTALDPCFRVRLGANLFMNIQLVTLIS